MAQINLIQVKGNSFYCDGVFYIGVYVRGKEAVLIDSGISKDVAKEVDKALFREGIKVVAIINTHGHGDHCGGNAYLQQKYPEIKIFSTEYEKPFIEDPLMASVCFCDGAMPFEEITTFKPIAPQQVSRVTDVITPYEDQKIYISGIEFEIITLPGHTRGMIAVKTPDNVLYCGDAIFGEEAFKKHAILFYTFIREALHSIHKLRNVSSVVDSIVAYHRGVLSHTTSLIDAHEERLLDMKENILLLLKEKPFSLEELVARMMQINAIPDTLVSYALTKASLQAYLAYLEQEKRLRMRVTDGVARAYSV